MASAPEAATPAANGARVSGEAATAAAAANGTRVSGEAAAAAAAAGAR